MHKTLPTHDPRREHKPNSPYQPPNGTRGNDKARKRFERKKKSTPIPTFRAEKKEEKMSFFAPKKKKKTPFRRKSVSCRSSKKHVSLRFLHRTSGSDSVVGIVGIIGEVDEQLREAAFGGCVVPQDRGECCIAQRLGKALSKGFASTVVIAQSGSVSQLIQ